MALKLRPASGAERTALVVSDGRRGIENQALGLAEALARAIPLHVMPVQVARTGPVADPGPIQPDLWIGCGRAALRASAVHRRAFPRAVFVYVQDPRADHDRFDLIIAPRHDRLTGRNVLNILGSPNRITPDRLAEARRQFAEWIDPLPEPRIAVLIGGDSKHHRITREVSAYLIERLGDLHRDGASLMITVSRRTPDPLRRALAARFSPNPRCLFFDGQGPNPYFAFLAGADWVFVTEDSTNMLTEAASAGPPVYRLPLEGRPGKFARLYDALEAEGAVRPYLGRLERWEREPLHETEKAARAVLEIMGARSEL